MNRDAFLEQIRGSDGPWDVVIIGGGATGLGAAVDAAARGFRTLLLEQSDFAKGTSSRSTKLIHGGVRYLQQGNVSLVFEALHERGRLLENAPHLVRNLEFVLPAYSWWERPFYGIGLKIYDVLAGKYSLGKSHVLSKNAASKALPGLKTERLRGGIAYHDGQFDDARLAVALARTAADLGAVVVNYARVEDLKKDKNGRTCGVIVRELESGAELDISARAVVNATGVFVDAIRLKDDADARPIISPSQGIHVVLDRAFLPSDNAMLIPRTADGRVLFAVPWYDRVLLGTTDTPVDRVRLDPRPLNEEIDYLLDYAGRYLERAPTRDDVLSTFAGLRPLVSSGDENDTASISRDHVVRISKSGLITVTGGKWTTYRKMGEDTIDEAIRIGKLDERPSTTADLRLHGWIRPASTSDRQDGYGSDRPRVEEIIRAEKDGADLLHSKLPYRCGEVTWAVRFEMARTLEDVLARRTRALLLDAEAAVECAPAVAERMAKELGQSEEWKEEQTRSFTELACEYMPAGTRRQTVTGSQKELSVRK